MAVFDYHGLLAHVGHSFECIVYGDEQNVALACNNCHEVIIDFNRPDFSNASSDRAAIDTLFKELSDGSDRDDR
jgi:cytidine deaminase